MPRPCVAIYWVANQRMAKMREVHANLMRASGFQIALHGADGWARFVRHCEHPVMGAHGLACRAGNNGMLNTVARMASKRGIDGAMTITPEVSLSRRCTMPARGMPAAA